MGAKIHHRGVLTNSRNFRNLEPDNLPSDQKKNGELIGTDELAVVDQRRDGGGEFTACSHRTRFKAARARWVVSKGSNEHGAAR